MYNYSIIDEQHIRFAREILLVVEQINIDSTISPREREQLIGELILSMGVSGNGGDLTGKVKRYSEKAEAVKEIREFLNTELKKGEFLGFKIGTEEMVGNKYKYFCSFGVYSEECYDAEEISSFFFTKEEYDDNFHLSLLEQMKGFRAIS